MDDLPEVQPSISQWDEVFHVMAATSALFGYPPPPSPRTLKSKPEWNEYVTNRNQEGASFPDTDFYGRSPFAKDMVLDEAHHALRVLNDRIKLCKKNKDKAGQAGLAYVAETIKMYLAKVQGLPEDKGFLSHVPIVNFFVKRRKEKGQESEDTLKTVDSKIQKRGYGNRRGEAAKPEFFRAKSDKELRVIYHTLRNYVLDENISLEGKEVSKGSQQRYVRYDVQRDTNKSSDDAFEFNKWLALFFSDLFQDKNKR